AAAERFRARQPERADHVAGGAGVRAALAHPAKRHHGQRRDGGEHGRGDADLDEREPALLAHAWLGRKRGATANLLKSRPDRWKHRRGGALRSGGAVKRGRGGGGGGWGGLAAR